MPKQSGAAEWIREWRLMAPQRILASNINKIKSCTMSQLSIVRISPKASEYKLNEELENWE